MTERFQRLHRVGEAMNLKVRLIFVLVRREVKRFWVAWNREPLDRSLDYNLQECEQLDGSCHLKTLRAYGMRGIDAK
jgi:hypothetical protein